MKIALIFPPSIYQTKQTMPPLGIAWLAAVLKNNGYKDVYIIDSAISKLTNSDVVEIVQTKGADIIGLSFGTQIRFNAFALAKMLKNRFPGVPIIAGGIHPSLTAEDTLANIYGIDIIVRGEGELTFLELVTAMDTLREWRNTPGISFRGINGKIFHSSNRLPIPDLDSLPFPARELLPVDDYKQKIPLSDKICTSMITSRGCPYSCIYCSTAKQWGHAIRYRSPKNIVNEIEHLMSNYRLDGVGFFDDCFTMNRQRAIDICQEILRRKLKIRWWCEARANTIDEEIVNWMQRAGCEHISMAIESGSDSILKNIKKAITVEMGINACKIIKKAGIKLKAFFMLGLPGETYEDIKKTVFLSRWLEYSLGVDETTQSLTIIYPFTELEAIAKKLGTLPHDFSWSSPFEEKRSYPPLSPCPVMPIFEQPDLTYEHIYQFTRKAKLHYFALHPFHAARKMMAKRENTLAWLTTTVNK